MSRLITKALGFYLNLQVTITWYLTFHNVTHDPRIIKVLVLMMIAISISFNITILYGTILLSLPIIKKLLELLQFINTPENIVIKTGLVLFLYLVISQSIIDII